MKKFNKTLKIEIDGEEFFIRTTPSFFASPISWVIDKYKNFDPLKNEDLFTCFFV